MDSLRDQLANSDPEACKAALVEIARLGSEAEWAAADVLQLAKASPDPLLRSVAVTTLAKIAKHMPDIIAELAWLPYERKDRSGGQCVARELLTLKQDAEPAIPGMLAASCYSVMGPRVTVPLKRLLRLMCSWYENHGLLHASHDLEACYHACRNARSRKGLLSRLRVLVDKLRVGPYGQRWIEAIFNRLADT